MTMRAPAADLPLRLENVTVAAGAITMLDSITLTLSAGAPTVLIGPNGSGKTTLLRLAMGLIACSRGRISWGGQEDSPPLRRAIVFQRPVMLRRSAGGNIRYALRAAGTARAERSGRVADLLTAANVAYALPRRDDARVMDLLTEVGLAPLANRPARKLSGGEQQRLALARALARNPEILLLDEPTASLDPAATKAIEDVIRGVSQRGIKVLMATHDLGEARRLAGEIVMLHRGRIVETGPASTFFNTPQTEDAKRFIAGELLI